MKNFICFVVTAILLGSSFGLAQEGEAPTEAAPPTETQDHGTTGERHETRKERHQAKKERMKEKMKEKRQKHKERHGNN